MGRSALVAVVIFVASACGDKSERSSNWFRIVGEGGIGPTLTLADVSRDSAQADVDPATQGSLVFLRFTPAGSKRFARLTHALALAGKRDGRPYHFAVLVDGRAIERPYIDYKLYPAGVPGDSGIQVDLPRRQEAERLAKRLRGR